MSGKSRNVLMFLFIMVISILGSKLTIAKAAVKLDKPAISAEEVNEKSCVIITIGKTANADGFRIYMKEPESSKFKKIKTLSKNGNVERKYKVGNLEPGIYKFRVKAYKNTNSGKKWSAYSNSVKVIISEKSSENEENKSNENDVDKLPNTTEDQLQEQNALWQIKNPQTIHGGVIWSLGTKVLLDSYTTLDSEGTFWAWGSGEEITIGDDKNKATPKPRKIIDNVVSISGAYGAVYGLKKDGSLYSWGTDTYGLLGTGGKGNAKCSEAEITELELDLEPLPAVQTEPVKIMDDVREICDHEGDVMGVIKNDGSLWVWGENSFIDDGELFIKASGLGDPYVYTTTVYDNFEDYLATVQDVPYRLMDNVSKAFLSDEGYSSVIKNDGSLWSWGFGSSGGSLGDERGMSQSAYPVKVMVDNVVYWYTYCAGNDVCGAIDADGNLWMYGDNCFGELGFEPSESDSRYCDGGKEKQRKPRKVASDVKLFKGAGNDWGYTYVLKNDGTLWAWGSAPLYGHRDFEIFKLADNVTDFECFMEEVVILKEDNSCWFWHMLDRLPRKVSDDVKYVSDDGCYIKLNGEMWRYSYNRDNFTIETERLGATAEDNSVQTDDKESDFLVEGSVLLKYTGRDVEVTIPEGITEIFKYAFSSNGYIKNITLPEGLKTIGHRAFDGCSNLESIHLPDSLTSIADYAFCNSGIKIIDIPDKVESIGMGAFLSCDNLETANLGKAVSILMGNPFEGCSNLENINVDDDNQFFSSQNGVLFNKTMTILLIYPDGKYENSYEIPKSVTEISPYAFHWCKTNKIIIPSSVTLINAYAFNYYNDNDYGIKKIVYCGTEEMWRAINIHSYGNEGIDNAAIIYNY